MRADRDDRPLDLVQRAQQLDVDVFAGVVTFDVGGDDEQPVGAHQRRQHAGAAGQRRGDERTADTPEPDPDPVVHPDRRGELAREPRAERSAGAWPSTPSSSASSGAAKMSNVSDADTGYPGAPSTGVDSIAPSTTG